MSLALRPAWVLAAKKTLTGAGATVRCQSIYIVAPAQVGQPDRGRDELTKAGMPGASLNSAFQMMLVILQEMLAGIFSPAAAFSLSFWSSLETIRCR